MKKKIYPLTVAIQLHHKLSVEVCNGPFDLLFINVV